MNIEKILFTEEDIKKRTEELGKEIERDFLGEEILVVGVLKGAFIFMADLVRAIDLSLEVDFMAVSSYANSTTSSGVVHILKDLDSDISGKNVLIVEDIIDSGITLNYLKSHLEKRGAKTIKVCTLLDKPGRRELEMDIDYVGFQIENKFIVGYGLDYQQKYRNLPYIAYIE